VSPEAVEKLLGELPEADRPDAVRRIRWALSMGWEPIGFEDATPGSRRHADDLMFLTPSRDLPYAYLPRDVDRDAAD
jgi:hypothetical protein